MKGVSTRSNQEQQGGNVMKNDFAVPHLLRVAVGLSATLIMFVACSKENPGKDTSRAGSTSAVASASSGAGNTSGVKACDGSKKTRDMDEAYNPQTMDVGKFADYVHSIGFDCNEKHQPRVCKQDATTSCKDSKKDRADVTVGAAQGSSDVETIDNTNPRVVHLKGTHGYVIARFANNDKDKTEDWLQIPPGGTAYWLIEPYQGGVRSRFVTLEQDGTTWKTGDLIPPIPGFGGCGNPTPHDEEAGFADCSLSPYSTEAKPLTPTIEDVKSSWISCVAGCCTTEGVRGQGSQGGAKKPSSRSGAKSPSA